MKKNNNTELVNMVENKKTTNVKKTREKKTAAVETANVQNEETATEPEEKSEEARTSFPENSSIYAWFSGTLYRIYVHNAEDHKAYRSFFFHQKEKAIRYAYMLRKQCSLPISPRALRNLGLKTANAEAEAEA